MTARIGLLGGTFDPVHQGHMNAANQILSELTLQQLFMIPAFQTVHKEQPAITSQVRLEMLTLACEEYGAIEYDDREILRGGPSYSLLTLKEYRNLYPEDCLYFILGMDALEHFDTWYKWREFLGYVNLIVVERPGTMQHINHDITDFLQTYSTSSLDEIKQSKSGLIYKSSQAMLQYSSTEVRENINNPDKIADMMPEKVLNYIHEHKLYR